MRRLELGDAAEGLPAAFAGVALWTVDLDGADEPALDRVWLAPEEEARARRFVFPRDRRRYERTRRCLRLLLAQRLEARPQDLQLAVGEHGRPRLASHGAALDFNVSHSEHLALIGIAEHGPIGVDLECRRPMSDLRALAEAYFTPNEQSEVLVDDAEERVRRFFRVWTRKEACLKAWGSGLTWSPRLFDTGSCGVGPAITAPLGAVAPVLCLTSLRLVDNPSFEAAVSLGSRAGPR